MDIIGPDLHKRESQLSITADDGPITDRRIVTMPGAVHRRVGRSEARRHVRAVRAEHAVRDALVRTRTRDNTWC